MLGHIQSVVENRDFVLAKDLFFWLLMWLYGGWAFDCSTFFTHFPTYIIEGVPWLKSGHMPSPSAGPAGPPPIKFDDVRLSPPGPHRRPLVELSGSRVWDALAEQRYLPEVGRDRAPGTVRVVYNPYNQRRYEEHYGELDLWMVGSVPHHPLWGSVIEIWLERYEGKACAGPEKPNPRGFPALGLLEWHLERTGEWSQNSLRTVDAVGGPGMRFQKDTTLMKVHLGSWRNGPAGADSSALPPAKVTELEKQYASLQERGGKEAAS